MKTFTTNNTTFTTNENETYFYAIWTENGKQMKKRIKKAEFEQAEREALIEEAQESIDTEATKEYDQWAAEADAEYEARKAAEEAKNRQDEANYEAEISKPKKTRKPRRSKDIAYEGNGLTLTAKQVDFMRHLPDTNFWEYGLDSCIWIDCLCDDIEGQFKDKPMTVGAMISTICEKGLGQRGRDESRKGKPATFALTELGKIIAAELGVH